MKNKDRIKEIVLFLLVAGAELSKSNLTYTLTELADLSCISGEDDFQENTLCKEFSSTVIFVNTSVQFFIRAKKDEKEFDNWVEYYKQQLIENEEFSLITYLEL